MVANAGIISTWGTIVDSTWRLDIQRQIWPNDFVTAPVEHWDNIFATNARGVFLCYKYAAQQMIVQGWGGRIIGASSIGGKRGDILRFTCQSHLVRSML
jgi:NAD(P)-dependent dehydrogenase (short-subunit alcohol dehydrogenase family)